MLAAGDSCDVSVTFTPSATGPASGTLTIASTEGATAALALSGTGVAPALAFAPPSHDFGEVQVGRPGGPMTVSLANTGSGEATALAFVAPGNGFAADTSACGTSLGAGASCEVTIVFTPAATGAATGTLMVESDEGAMATLALSGTGVTPALTFTPERLVLSDVQVGTPSEPMTVRLENTGTGEATALGFMAPGNGFAADTTTCGTRLPASASCEVIVTFTPAAAGRVDATLTVESAEGATATLDLSGATATFRYDFAEGATGYFTTTLGLFNPDRAATANVEVRLLPEGRAPIVLPITLAPFGRETVDVNAAVNGATGVAAIVTADRPIAPLRQMSWDARGFGSTLESGAPGPSTTHYFAEGATAIWDLFYLLANDNDAEAQVTIEYLRDQGEPITQHVTVPAHARQTVWVNAVPGMANTQGGAIITADVPIAAERSMYLSAGGWPAGASSRGAHSPADTWYFAEGSTRFFDHFLLLMNPGAETAATVDVRYQLADGQTVTTRHVVPPQARRTILVETEDPALADQLMAAMTVSASQPIVAERAFWWGPTAASWYESSASVGSVESGTVWAIGEAWSGGPMAEDAYVLLANTAAEAGVVRVTLVYDDGNSDAREVAMAGQGRVTLLLGALFPASDGRRFSVLLESLGGDTAVPIVVDVSRYQSTDGRFGNAGGSTTATRIR
ncbi:MAG: choice-of-anchor D domain-containing protein, partial [Acidimicrobiales bacterium]